MKKIIALCAFVLGAHFMNPGESVRSQPVEQGNKKDSKKKEAKMECTLTLKTNKAKVGDIVPAEVEIKNVSKEDLAIQYVTMPFYHLDLLVHDPAGKKISIYPYKVIISIIYDGQITLRPGEAYRAGVDITATSPQDSWKTPGTYKITAIYEYMKEKAVSKQVELTLTPAGK